MDFPDDDASMPMDDASDELDYYQTRQDELTREQRRPNPPAPLMGPMEGATRIPVAFKHCNTAVRSSGSSFKVTCGQGGCTLARTITSTKWAYGHILRELGHEVRPCSMSLADYRKVDPDWVQQLELLHVQSASKRKNRDSNGSGGKKAASKKAIAAIRSGNTTEAASILSGSTPGSSLDGDQASRASPASALTPSPIGWAMLSPEEKRRRRQICQEKWDLAFAVDGLAYHLASSETFRDALESTCQVPDFRLHCRQTMAGPGLQKMSIKADANKQIRLNEGLQTGFVHVTDGWRSKNKKNFHNHILLSMMGPVYVKLVDVTGESGAGENIAAEVLKVQNNLLPYHVQKAVTMGVTDTPSANRKAWRLLEAELPRQIWMNCMLHEVGLFFKEVMTKVGVVRKLSVSCLQVVKWFNNHGEILKLFRAAVRAEVEHGTSLTSRQLNIGFYQPGDTRMASTFRMAHRMSILRPVLTAVGASAEFDSASQKALKAWSDAQKDPLKKVPKDPRGVYRDVVKHNITSIEWYDEINGFIKIMKAPMYLMRLMDSGSPCIGKVYYSCCLVDKYIRVAVAMGKTSYAQAVHDIFMKRWKRWHRPIHTLAYALDPCYHGHDLDETEMTDVTAALKKLVGAGWAGLKVELTSWRGTAAHTEDEVWAEADSVHGWQWWSNFGDGFPKVKPIAVQVLSKCPSASATEWNWSDVGHTLNKSSQHMLTSSLNAKVNVRAMQRLNKNVKGCKVLLTKLPTMDIFLDELVGEIQKEAIAGGVDLDNAGDDDGSEEEEEEESGSEPDDEQIEADVMAEDLEELYELPSRNSALETALEEAVNADF